MRYRGIPVAGTVGGLVVLLASLVASSPGAAVLGGAIVLASLAGWAAAAGLFTRDRSERGRVRAALGSLTEEQYQVLLACASLGEVPVSARVGDLSALQGAGLAALAPAEDGGRPVVLVSRVVRQELGL